MKLISMVGLAAAALGVVALWRMEQQTRAQLAERNEALREELRTLKARDAVQRPTTSLRPLSCPASALPGEQWQELLRLRGEVGVLCRDKSEAVRLRADNSRMRSNWVEQLVGGKKLKVEQLAPYLKANQRSAESLLAAAQLTGDASLLREALAKYPKDPRVNFAACFALKDLANPVEFRQQLAAFREAAGDNALANYLSARDYFKSGRADQAVEQLVAASGKPGFQDYYAESVRQAESAYQAAGLTSLEAAQAACAQPLLHLAELKGLAPDLLRLADQYRQGGDEASAQAALQMGVTLGRRLGETAPQGTVIGQLVGLAIERQILETLAPTDAYDAAGHSVRDRLDELHGQREEIKAVFQKGERVLPTLSEAELAGYYDRVRTSGEWEAMRWVVGR